MVLVVLLSFTASIGHSAPGISYTSNTPASGTEISEDSFLVETYITESPSTFGNATCELFNLAGELVDTQTDFNLSAFNLEHYIINVSNQNLALDDDQSGLAYSPTTDTVYSIRNGDTEINELYRNGTLKRTISMTGFEDTEAISFLNNSGGYDWFAITEERRQNFSIIKINSETSTITFAGSINYDLDLGTSANVGLEGIAYDSGRDVFYAVKEKTPMAVYQINVSSGTPVVTSLFDAPTIFIGVATDLSDLYYDNNTDNLFILSDESKKLMQVTLDGTIVDTLSVSSLAQPEGVTFDTTGETLWIMSEPDSWSTYNAQNFTASCTFTGLADGIYFYNVTAYDASENGNTTAYRNITIDSGVDSTLPIISFASPTFDDLTVTANTTIIINITITESNLTQIIYNWNGTNFSFYDEDLTLLWPLDNVAAIGEDGSTVVDLSQRNQTVTPQGTYSFVSNGKHGGAIELNEVNSYLDTGFGSFNPTTRSFTVSFWTNRQGNTCHTGDDDHLFGTGVHATNDRFYFRCRDDLWSMRLQGNSAIYGSVVDLNKWYFVTIVNNHSESKAYLYLDGEVELSQSYTSYIMAGDLYVGTISNSIVEGWGGLFDDVMIWNRAFTVEEINQLYMISISKYDSDSWILEVNQNQSPTQNLGINTYTYYAYAQDGAGNNATTEIRTITTGTSDIDAPSLTIQSPTNNSNYTTNSVDLNFTVIDSESLIDKCWYSLNGGVDNISLNSCYNSSIAPGDGTYNIIFYANDTIGNLNTSETLTFTIDATAPTLSIQYPTNNSNYSADSVDLNFTVSDATLSVDTCWYSLDGGANTTLVSCDNTTITPGEGTHNIIFYANDTFDNLDTSENLTFRVDLTGPTVSLDYPTEGLTISINESILLNYTVSDSGSGINTSTCSYMLDGAYQVLITDCQNITFNVSVNVNGNHNISISANDTVGNQGNSVLINFTINTVDSDGDGIPDISDYLVYTESEVTTTGITNLNITVNGTGTNESYTGMQEVVIYDGSVVLIRFNHNFSQSYLDLSNITIIKDPNYILINMSGQLQGNKTVYITDNSFASLCVKNAEIASISAMSGLCTGTNETDFTSCLGGSANINGITCVDQGSTIMIGNLTHSAIRGVQATDTDSDTVTKKSINMDYEFDCNDGNLEMTTSTSGISVILFGLDNSYREEEETDGNGEVSFTVSNDGLYRLYASKRGYSPVSLNLNLELCKDEDVIEEDIEKNTTDIKEPLELVCGEYDVGETWKIEYDCNTCDCNCKVVSGEAVTSCDCTNRDCFENEDAELAIEEAEDAINKAKYEGKLTKEAEQKLLEAKRLYNTNDYVMAKDLAKKAKSLLNQESATDQDNGSTPTENESQPVINENANQNFDLVYLVLGLGILVVAILFVTKFGNKKKKSK